MLDGSRSPGWHHNTLLDGELVLDIEDEANCFAARSPMTHWGNIKGNIGIMEKKTETTILCRGYI